MAADTVTPRSRRVLLAATAGSLAALATQALGRPLPTRAASVVLGAINTATSTTKIQMDSVSAAFWGSNASGWGLYGSSSSHYGVYGTSGSNYGVYGTSGSSYGVFGESGSSVGAYGRSGSNAGVFGESNSGVGVWGASGFSYGVYGSSSSSSRPATVGQSRGHATGLLGYSGDPGGSLPAAPAMTGVYGYAAQEDSSARGVTGQTTAGRGLNGRATSGHGVHGYASSGIGVYAAAGASGTALHAEGRVSFKTAGLATIGSGTSSKTVTPGVDLTSSSKILCTLMGNAGGATTVKRVAVNTTTDAFTIYLTAAATAAVKVAWFLIG